MLEREIVAGGTYSNLKWCVREVVAEAGPKGLRYRVLKGWGKGQVRDMTLKGFARWAKARLKEASARRLREALASYVPRVYAPRKVTL